MNCSNDTCVKECKENSCSYNKNCDADCNKVCCGGGVENYDPSKPVCDSQDDYNQAFRNALKYNREQNMKSAGNWIWVYLVIHLVFLFWGVMLASKVQPGPYRTMHMMFALLFSPVYVLSHYLGMLNEN